MAGAVDSLTVLMYGPVAAISAWRRGNSLHLLKLAGSNSVIEKLSP